MKRDMKASLNRKRRGDDETPGKNNAAFTRKRRVQLNSQAHQELIHLLHTQPVQYVLISQLNEAMKPSKQRGRIKTKPAEPSDCVKGEGLAHLWVNGE